MVAEKFAISMSQEVYAEIECRAMPGERSTKITLSLERYFAILQAARRELAKQFEDAEIALVCDALNGSWLGDSVNLRLAWATVQDAIEIDALDVKWQVYGPSLVEKLRGLDFAQTVALVDAVELWWTRTTKESPQPQPTVAGVLR